MTDAAHRISITANVSDYRAHSYMKQLTLAHAQDANMTHDRKVS